MFSRFASVTIACSLLITHVFAQATNPRLVGTWTSKSAKVLTGPDFYDPSTNTIHEPPLTGISYSFTEDGYYEEALFRAIPNAVTPSCPSAIIQWQHGSYVQAPDSSLALTPIEVDGRQILSEPCKLDTAILTRYHQTENFTKAVVQTDPYNNLLRLDLYGWDGTAVIPMWLAKSDPLILPTTTLTPLKTASGSRPSNTGSASKLKRAIGIEREAVHRNILEPLSKRTLSAGDQWFWIGIGFLGLGSVMFFCF